MHRIVAASVAPPSSVPARRPLVLGVPFPGLRVINRWFRRPEKPVRLDAEDLLSLLPREDLDRRVAQGRTLAEVVQRDWYYFARAYDRLSREMEGSGGTA